MFPQRNDMDARTLIRTLNAHADHAIKLTLTPQHPDKMGRMDCLTCGHGRVRFLMWLSADQCYLTGLFPNRNQALDAHESQRRRARKRTRQAHWSTITPKEQSYYRRYQPATDFGRSQLWGDRMLYGKRYSGFALGSIPLSYLRQCLTIGKFTADDKAYISRHIALRTGTDPGALVR